MMPTRPRWIIKYRWDNAAEWRVWSTPKGVSKNWSIDRAQKSVESLKRRFPKYDFYLHYDKADSGEELTHA